MNLFGDNDAIQTYREAFNNSWADDTPIEQVRFAALDCETTGLDPRKDAVISIGAITVIDGQILLDDQYEALLKIIYNTSSVVVHGITAQEAAEHGINEAEALEGLLSYLGDAVIVGHHIGFDVEILRQGCQRRFGIDLQNRWIDTMDLTLNLERDGMFDDSRTNAPFPRPVHDDLTPRSRDFSLDGLCRRFGIAPHDRHTAAGDAFITAQIFLKLYRYARHAGRLSLGALAERFEDDE